MKHPISKKYLRNLDYSIDKAAGGSAPATPIVITMNESADTYTITGGTLADLRSDFETKNVIVKSLLAYTGDTAKAIGVGDDWETGGEKVSFILPNSGTLYTFLFKPNGSYVIVP